MKGHGSCAPCCLDCKSSAPVQASPSHHWMQWAGGLSVASGALRLSFPLLLGLEQFPPGPCTPRGEEEPEPPL